MADWLSNIRKSLKACGCEDRLWGVGDGELLLTPHGARVIGCRVAGVEGNLLWHNPGMEDAGSVKACLVSGGIGGDRLWVGPEVGFMWPSLKLARKDPIKHYLLPTAMDPGEYRVVEDLPGHLRVTAEMSLTDHRLKKRVVLRVSRRVDGIGPVPGLPGGVRSVGFAIANRITWLEGDAGVAAGLWDLLQVPAGGWLVCPTVRAVKRPRSYYEPFGARHVKCGKDAVRFLIDGKRRIKMGLSATETNGRMGYMRPVGKKKACLIVRMFLPQPGGVYVDLPRSSNQFAGGDALQAYNDDGTYGGFGEMEHHEPAVVVGKEPVSREGVCVTRVMVGGERVIRKVGEEMLGVRV